MERQAHPHHDGRRELPRRRCPGEAVASRGRAGHQGIQPSVGTKRTHGQGRRQGGHGARPQHQARLPRPLVRRRKGWLPDREVLRRRVVDEPPVEDRPRDGLRQRQQRRQALAAQHEREHCQYGQRLRQGARRIGRLAAQLAAQGGNARPEEPLQRNRRHCTRRQRQKRPPGDGKLLPEHGSHPHHIGEPAAQPQAGAATESRPSLGTRLAEHLHAKCQRRAHRQPLPQHPHLRAAGSPRPQRPLCCDTVAAHHLPHRRPPNRPQHPGRLGALRQGRRTRSQH